MVRRDSVLDLAVVTDVAVPSILAMCILIHSCNINLPTVRVHTNSHTYVMHVHTSMHGKDRIPRSGKDVQVLQV